MSEGKGFQWIVCGGGGGGIVCVEMVWEGLEGWGRERERERGLGEELFFGINLALPVRFKGELLGAWGQESYRPAGPEMWYQDLFGQEQTSG